MHESPPPLPAPMYPWLNTIKKKNKQIQINSCTKNISAAGMILRVHLHNNNIPLVRLKLIKITNRNFSDLADKARDKHREIAIVDHEITLLK